MATDPRRSWCVRRGPSMHSPATRSTYSRQPGIPCCRSSTGDMASDPGRSWCVRRGPSMHSPATRSTYSRQPGIPSCRSSTGDMATDPGRSWCAHRIPSMCCQPAPPATRSTSCRSSTGDMATDPGRSWCARRGPSITAGQRRQPGAPAAGAAPVTWPPTRGVPGALAGAPRSPPASAGNQELLLQEQHR